MDLRLLMCLTGGGFLDISGGMAKAIIETLSKLQQEQFEAYSKILREENKRLNLTRIVDPEQIRLRHFEDSLVIYPKLLDIQMKSEWMLSMIDVGSGGGFPGLALAIALPEWRVCSVEATGKKVDFQLQVVEELGLDNVEVLHERAEDLAKDEEYREQFDVGVARAVGHLSIIAELTIPFVSKGGRFFAWKGPRLDEEKLIAKQAVKILASSEISETSYELPGDIGEPTDYRIAEVLKRKKTPKSYPREYKDIKSKPLGTK